jgi:predicted DNA-binding protein
MSKDVEKAALSYRVPAGLKQALQNLADADRRKLGPYIQLVLEAHVEQKRKEGKKR